MLLDNFIVLFLDSAPWLLLGLLLAGMLKMFVPMAWMQKQLGGHGFKTTVKAALLGAPLPLCSCGVIPAAVGLRRSGASKAATASFLVSTPETGIDSVTVSYVLLGPFMAIVRPIAAVISAIVAGLLVGLDDKDESVLAGAESPAKQAGSSSCCSTTKVAKKESACSDSAHAHAHAHAPSPSESHSHSHDDGDSCCSSTKGAATPIAAKKESACSDSAHAHAHSPSESHSHSHDDGDSCCDSTKDIASELQGTPILSRIGKGIHFAATDLVKDVTVWLMVGLFFAALVQTYVPADFMLKWGDGIWAMLAMVIISVPMFICATASTPIAAGLLLAGVSPGAVLVFMLAGPATNIATLGVVTKELGKHALFGYLGGVLGVALVSGVVVNYLVDTYGFIVMPQVGDQHDLLPSFIVYGSGVLLAILMAKVLLEMVTSKLSGKPEACCS